LNRRAIGIDISGDAIEIARSRLATPIRSESKLLTSGRAAFRTANDEALALLNGLDIVPVHRNKGIDAFLKDEIDGCPIPICVQRPDETISEAAAQLYNAAKTKRAPLMFLIAIKEGEEQFSFANELPSEVCVIDGTALSVAKILERFKLDHQARLPLATAASSNP